MPPRHPENAPLRYGWTTGACATAAAHAAYTAFVTGGFPDPVSIVLPGGEAPSFPLLARRLEAGRAAAAVRKDAGDDPDVTHGALVDVTVAPAGDGSGVSFRAGEGVGTVTRPGLPLGVGEPAINPGPRRMMEVELGRLAERLGGPRDVAVTVAIPGGARLAERTMNERLGIVGGLSVLGTTGIVKPYSCAAWVASIHSGIDVARASGLSHLAGATGSTSEAAVQRLYGLDAIALIDMGDFAGAVLKYLARHPVERLTIAGGFAKLVKLAQGHLDLRAVRCSVDLPRLADMLDGFRADGPTAAAARKAGSANELLGIAEARGLAIGEAVAEEARRRARAVLRGSEIALDVVIFDRAGRLVARAGP